MAKGFFLGINKGIGRILDEAGKVVEVPVNRIPKGLKAGQDFAFRASDSGNFHIAAPVSSRNRTSNTPRDRQQYAVQRLMSKGWTGPQASGIVGRFMVEAFPDLRTNAVGDKEIPGASHGIGQWNRERKAAMIAYTTGRVPGGKYSDHPLVKAAAQAAPGGYDGPNDFNGQLDFFDWEVRNSPSERIAYAAIRRSKTAEDAATGMMHYERPRGYLSRSPSSGMHYSRTVKNAQNVMKQYDPNYEAKVDFAASQSDIDAANMSVRDETGDLIVAERARDSSGFETMEFGDIFGNDIIGDDFNVPEEEDEEDTISDTLITGEELETPEGPDTSDSKAFIQNMIEQGQQASAGSLPSLPTFRDLFGEG